MFPHGPGLYPVPRLSQTFIPEKPPHSFNRLSRSLAVDNLPYSLRPFVVSAQSTVHRVANFPQYNVVYVVSFASEPVERDKYRYRRQWPIPIMLRLPSVPLSQDHVIKPLPYLVDPSASIFYVGIGKPQNPSRLISVRV